MTEPENANPVPHIQADKIENLLSRIVELFGRTVVAIPIEYEMRREHTSAGYRRDVCD